MDAFEETVAACVTAAGHWTRTKVKVGLTSEDKDAISSISSPRWELDVVAYAPRSDILRVIECKSYLDSGGVDHRHLEPGHRYDGRYKLFTRPNHWPVIRNRLRTELCEAGLISASTTVELYLAFGKARDLDGLMAKARAGGWGLIGPDWLYRQLEAAARGGWENTPLAIIAKLLLRTPPVGSDQLRDPFLPWA